MSSCIHRVRKLHIHKGAINFIYHIDDGIARHLVSLLEHPGVEREINLEALDAYFTLGEGRKSQAFGSVEGVKGILG